MSATAVMQRVMHWEHERDPVWSNPEKWIAFLECNHTVEFTETDVQVAAEDPLRRSELACPTCAGHLPKGPSDAR